MEKHGLVRGIILPSIIKNIMDEFSWTEEKALDMFYASQTGKAFSDNESGLYGQSTLYISNLFIEEIKNHN